MTKEESRELTGIAVKALQDKKALTVDVIEIDQISPLADYFVIASGSNFNQTDAMCEEVQQQAAMKGFEPDHVEGHRNANWTLIDYKGVIVHVFDEEARDFYDLANLWKDGNRVDPESFL